jgi:DNA-binding response OmpR family regulator
VQPYKILVAEDEAPFRRQVGQMLTQHGFEVISVEDGYQALDFAVHAKPDLMLLDVHMPAGDGFSVHDRVQLHPELATRPVIYMTHDPTQEIEAVAAEHGAFKLLHKPFEMSTLLETINAALVGRTADAA